VDVTKQKFEQLIRQALDDLRLSGHIVTTTDIYEDPAVLCSTVATSNGRKQIYVDFHALTDEDSVVREIKQQLTT